MLVYKILRQPEWAELREAGAFDGAPVDRADGYVHLSTAEQAPGTAAKHFAGEDDLVLLAFDTAGLGDDLRWEPSRGGQNFPHLYRQLRVDDVMWWKPLPLSGAGHVFPPEMA